MRRKRHVECHVTCHMAYFNEAMCEVLQSTCSVPRIMWHTSHVTRGILVIHIGSILKERVSRINNHVYWDTRKRHVSRYTWHVTRATCERTLITIRVTHWHMACHMAYSNEATCQIPQSICYFPRFTWHVNMTRGIVLSNSFCGEWDSWQ